MLLLADLLRRASVEGRRATVKQLKFWGIRDKPKNENRLNTGISQAIEYCTESKGSNELVITPSWTSGSSFQL